MEAGPKLTNSAVHGQALWLLYRIYVAIPYPLRRLLTVLVVMAILVAKPTINRKRPVPTPRNRLYTLSFWGVPIVDEAKYRLRVHGLVVRDLVLSLPEIEARADSDRTVVLDCVGGTRNVVRMRGLSLQRILYEVEPRSGAETAIFRCVDGYHEAIPIGELVAHGAFMAFRVHGQGIREMGYPLRLAIPGKYGYKWAKWVTEIELVEGRRKGYWESLGLPDRADVGDIF